MNTESNPHHIVLGKSGEFDEDDVIYISLDSLLDTRLGTLAKVDTSLAVAALNGNYRNRVIDHFEGISPLEFAAAYAKRDLETLKLSMVSNVSFLIRRIIKDNLALAVQQRVVTRINIELNVWPYTFEHPDEVEMLISCVRHHAYNNAVVRVVSMDPAHLTPAFVMSNYQLLVMYDWMHWLGLHKPAFEERGMPGVAVIAPQLFLDKVPSKEEIVEMSSGGKNVFELTEKMFAPLFRLNLLPASLFSVIDEVQKETIDKKLPLVSATVEQIEDAIKKISPQAHVEHAPAEGPVLDFNEIEATVAKEEEDDEFPLL